MFHVYVSTDEADYNGVSGVFELTSSTLEDCALITIVVDNVVEHSKYFEMLISSDEDRIDFKRHAVIITITDTSSKF